MKLSSTWNDKENVFDPHIGLPKELFEEIRHLVPLVGVELIIYDETKGFLLSYRDDEFYTGWHFIGGLLRYRESWSERIRKTAINEIGVVVTHKDNPFHVVENISETIDPRAHSVNLLFNCRLAENLHINQFDGVKLEPKTGQLGWFKNMPPNIIEMHRNYLKFWHFDKI